MFPNTKHFHCRPTRVRWFFGNLLSIIRRTVDATHRTQYFSDVFRQAGPQARGAVRRGRRLPPGEIPDPTTTRSRRRDCRSVSRARLRRGAKMTRRRLWTRREGGRGAASGPTVSDGSREHAPTPKTLRSTADPGRGRIQRTLSPIHRSRSPPPDCPYESSQTKIASPSFHRMTRRASTITTPSRSGLTTTPPST